MCGATVLTTVVFVQAYELFNSIAMPIAEALNGMGVPAMFQFLEQDLVRWVPHVSMASLSLPLCLSISVSLDLYLSLCLSLSCAAFALGVSSRGAVPINMLCICTRLPKSVCTPLCRQCDSTLDCICSPHL